MLRRLALGTAARLGPFRRLVLAGLTADDAGVPAPLHLLRPRRRA